MFYLQVYQLPLPVRDHAQSQQSITAIEKNNLQKESDRAIADMRGRMECKIEEIPKYTERQTAMAIRIIDSGIISKSVLDFADDEDFKDCMQLSSRKDCCLDPNSPDFMTEFMRDDLGMRSSLLYSRATKKLAGNKIEKIELYI